MSPTGRARSRPPRIAWEFGSRSSSRLNSFRYRRTASHVFGSVYLKQNAGQSRRQIAAEVESSGEEQWAVLQSCDQHWDGGIDVPWGRS